MGGPSHPPDPSGRHQSPAEPVSLGSHPTTPRATDARPSPGPLDKLSPPPPACEPPPVLQPAENRSLWARAASAVGKAASITVEASKTMFNGIVMLPVLVFQASPVKTAVNMLTSVGHGLLPLGFAFAGAGVIQATMAAQGGRLDGGQAVCVLLGTLLVGREVMKALGIRLEKSSIIDFRKASNEMLIDGMFGQELDTLRDPEFQKKCAAIRFNHWIQYLAAGTIRSAVVATTSLAVVVATLSRAPDEVKLAISVAAVVPLMTTIYLAYKFVRDEQRIAPLRQKADVVGNYLVHLDSIADMLASGGRRTVQERKTETTDSLDRTENAMAKRGMWFNVTAGSVGGVAIAYSTYQLMVWVGKGADVQTAFIIGGVVTTVTGAMVQLVDAFSDLTRMAPFVRGLRELWHSRKVDTPDTGRIKDGAIGLQLKEVSYGFGAQGRDVLSHVNFVVRPGEFVLLKGQEGCGKSTLLYLMAGVTHPKGGAVTVLSGEDAIPLDEVGTSEWRSSVAFALQEAKVYDGLTIRENILMGRTDLELMDRLVEATGFGAKLSDTVTNPDTGVTEKIFPDGLDTMMAAELGGRNLSGGQKKFIALIRALMKRPKILFLDETLNGLSEETATHILQFLKNLKPVLGYQPTIVMISHPNWHNSFADRVVTCSTAAKGIESETRPGEVHFFPTLTFTDGGPAFTITDPIAADFPSGPFTAAITITSTMPTGPSETKGAGEGETR